MARALPSSKSDANPAMPNLWTARRGRRDDASVEVPAVCVVVTLICAWAALCRRETRY